MPNTEIALADMVRNLYPNFGIPGIAHQYAAAGREISVHLPPRVYVARLASFDSGEAISLGVTAPSGKHIEIFEAAERSDTPSLQSRSLKGVLLETTANIPIIKQARFGPALLVTRIDADIGSTQYGEAMRLAVDLTGKILENLDALL